jgi:hypothetical protein
MQEVYFLFLCALFTTYLDHTTARHEVDLEDGNLHGGFETLFILLFVLLLGTFNSATRSRKPGHSQITANYTKPVTYRQPVWYCTLTQVLV